MFPESLVAARKLLEEITPLQTDCGRDDSRLRGAMQPRESSAGVPNVSAGDAPAP